MPGNYVQYQQSIASEFLAVKDRVRFFIEDNHWGEDGRYKEIILMNFLRRVLPANVAAGTGFVKNANGQLTDQIDIIIYKENIPKLFSEGDFVILMPQSVLGIIEVKSTSTSSSLSLRKLGRNNRPIPSAIDKAHRNGEIIGRSDIFNGIFSYETEILFSNRFQTTNLARQLRQKCGYINHICFGQDFFMKYWRDGNPRDDDGVPCYSFYDLSYKNIFNEQRINDSGLAFGYFISNLLETIYAVVAPDARRDQFFDFLYPLVHTKEEYRIGDCELKLDNR